MRIIHLVHNLDTRYGGPARSVPALAKGLKDLGSEQVLLSCRLYESERNDDISSFGLSHNSFGCLGPKVFGYANSLGPYLAESLKRSSSTILHVHNLWNFIPIVSSRAQRKFSVPLIISPRGNLFPWNLASKRFKKQLAMKIFQRKILEDADCLHVTSEQELNALRDLGFRNPIAQVPNGIELSQFFNLPNRLVAKSDLGLKADKKHFLFMSRIDRKKGLDILIDAFKNTYRDEWHLLIAGPIQDHTYWEICKKKLKSTGDQNAYTYLGMLDGVERLRALASADVFVLPTHSENFGVSILEALAGSKPVITTWGTPWRSISESNAGYITHANVKNVETALINIMDLDAQSRDQMGENARSIAQQYTNKITCKKMQGVYEWLLEKSSVPDCVDILS